MVGADLIVPCDGSAGDGGMVLFWMKHFERWAARKGQRGHMAVVHTARKAACEIAHWFLHSGSHGTTPPVAHGHSGSYYSHSAAAQVPASCACDESALVIQGNASTTAHTVGPMPAQALHIYSPTKHTSHTCHTHLTHSHAPAPRRAALWRPRRSWAWHSGWCRPRRGPGTRTARPPPAAAPPAAAAPRPHCGDRGTGCVGT